MAKSIHEEHSALQGCDEVKTSLTTCNPPQPVPAILAVSRGFQSQFRYGSSSGTNFDNSEIASPVNPNPTPKQEATTAATYMTVSINWGSILRCPHTVSPTILRSMLGALIR